MLRQEVDGATDVVETLCGHFHQARLAAALTLVGSVISERDETLLGQLLGVEARRLLLHATKRMGHDYRRILAVRIESGGLEQVGDDCRPHVPGLVGDSLDGHALLVAITNDRWLLG